MRKIFALALCFSLSAFAAYSPGPAYNDDNLSGLSSPATAISNLGITASQTELGYLSGVTSAVQTQIDSKPTISASTPSITFDHSVGAKTVVAKAQGKVVTVHFPAAAITDGAGTVCAGSALAAGLRPTSAVTFPVMVIDNGTTRKIGQLVIGSDGVPTFSVLGAGFTNAAAAGWDAVAVTYTIP